MNIESNPSMVSILPRHELPASSHVSRAGPRVADLPSEEVEHTGVVLAGDIVKNILYGACQSESRKAVPSAESVIILVSFCEKGS